MGRFINDYTDDWRAIRDRAYQDAGFRCIRCQHPFTQVIGEKAPPLPCDSRCDPTRGRRLFVPTGEQVHNISAGLSLTVHHFDGDKSNNAWWNLLVLCNSCHLTIQAKVIPERPYLWEHSDWIKPYVAGFYAFWFSRIQITREEAVGALDHWLSIGQPWLYQPHG